MRDKRRSLFTPTFNPPPLRGRRMEVHCSRGRRIEVDCSRGRREILLKREERQEEKFVHPHL